MTKRIIKLIFLCFLFFFLMLLFANKAGFYETKLNRAKTLTEEQIKAFEEDIKNGNEINVKDYIINQKNYTNKLSNDIYKVSLRLEKGIDKTIKLIFKYVNNTLED